ncbi:hypothetical protein DXG01_012779 [Tephrocybe rancida]|nr:hypothetical protein DXG01_012779 [Tephrocybe rancida]
MEHVAPSDLTFKLLSFTPSLTHLAHCCDEDESEDESEPEDHASISGPDDPEQPRVEYMRYLTTLEIGDPAPWSIVEALSSASSLISLSKLQSLVIHRSSQDKTHRAAQKVMSLTSGTLERLFWILPSLPEPDFSDISDSEESGSDSPPTQIDLTALHHVREVTIYHRTYFEDDLLFSLRTCGLPPNIEIFSLVVDLKPHVPTFRPNYDWAGRIDNELIEILDTAKYTQLRSIRMRVPHRPEYALSGSGLDAEIRDRFQRFCAMEMFQGTAVEFDPLHVDDTKMNGLLRFVSALGVAFAPFVSGTTDPASSQTPTSTSFMLFKGNHVESYNGGITYHSFRIPAVVRTNQGTLLAFAEGRAKTNKDYGNINVMYKRSTNDGKSAADWSALMQAATIGDDTIGNPTPVVDRSTGTIWLFMSWNAANTSQSAGVNPETGAATTAITKWGQRRVYVMKSTDDGLTFTGMDGSSSPTDLTATVTPKTKADGSAWAWDSVGPGAGLYTTDGTIIIPAQHRNIYSKDHGVTWLVQKISESTGEATITQLDDGSLYRNDRGTSTTLKIASRRWVARGTLTGGFSAFSPDDTLLDPSNGNEASVLFYNTADASTSTPSRTLFANSASTTTRTKMRIRLSYDNAHTWERSRPFSDFTLPAGSGTEGGYSSLVKTDDKNIGAMVETNLDTSDTASARGILWHKFNLGWVLAGCAC